MGLGDSDGAMVARLTEGGIGGEGMKQFRGEGKKNKKRRRIY